MKKRIMVECNIEYDGVLCDMCKHKMQEECDWEGYDDVCGIYCKTLKWNLDFQPMRCRECLEATGDVTAKAGGAR